MAKIQEVTVAADKVYKKKLFRRTASVVFVLLLAIVSIAYFVLYLIYNGGGFTVRIDREMLSSNIFLTLDPDSDSKSSKKRVLKSKAVEYMDNISINWINPDIDDEGTGVHNGENYYAYTFYLVNDGESTIDYWYEIDIEDTLLNLDKAIRVMVFRNGEKTVYAKLNSDTNEPEEGTKPFYDDGIAVLEEVDEFEPGDKDKFTVVVWIEGDDPDCNNELIGGGIKMSMKITEERIDKGR